MQGRNCPLTVLYKQVYHLSFFFYLACNLLNNKWIKTFSISKRETKSVREKRCEWFDCVLSGFMSRHFIYVFLLELFSGWLSVWSVFLFQRLLFPKIKLKQQLPRKVMNIFSCYRILIATLSCMNIVFWMMSIFCIFIVSEPVEKDKITPTKKGNKNLDQVIPVDELTYILTVDILWF